MYSVCVCVCAAGLVIYDDLCENILLNVIKIILRIFITHSLLVDSANMKVIRIILGFCDSFSKI